MAIHSRAGVGIAALGALATSIVAGCTSALPHAYTITGTVSGARAVVMTLSGGSSATTATDPHGNYSIGAWDGSYVITPSLAGYTFSPVSLSVTVNGADVTGVNFTATATTSSTYTMSGAVSGAVADGVLITLSGASTGTTTTTGGGRFSFVGLANGSYALVPSLAGYSFSPTSLAVTVSGADVTGQDFTATAGGASCPAAQVDCGSGCVDLETTAAHCGACDHDCSGGDCVGATCQPQTVVPNQDGALSMTISSDGHAIFWITATDALRCPASGCVGDPLVIANSLAHPTSDHPYVITIQGSQVYWRVSVTGFAVCPAAGCAFQTASEIGYGDSIRELTTGYDSYVNLVMGDHLYLCTGAGAQCNVDSCVSSDSQMSAVRDANGTYWLERTDPWGLYGCVNGTRTHLTSTRNGIVIRLHEDYLYNASTTDVERCPQDGCFGVPTPLATGETGTISSMAVDGAGVYFTISGSDSAATGSIRRVALDGTGGPMTLLDGLARPTSLHLSGGFVYWVERGLIAVPGSGRVTRMKL